MVRSGEEPTTSYLADWHSTNWAYRAMVAEQATEILSDHILIAHDLPDWLSIDDRRRSLLIITINGLKRLTDLSKVSGFQYLCRYQSSPFPIPTCSNNNKWTLILLFCYFWLQRGFPHTHPSQSSGLSEMEREKIYTWVLELSSPDTREHALLELRYFVTQVINTALISKKNTWGSKSPC